MTYLLFLLFTINLSPLIGLLRMDKQPLLTMTSCDAKSAKSSAIIPHALTPIDYWLLLTSCVLNLIYTEAIMTLSGR